MLKKIYLCALIIACLMALIFIILDKELPEKIIPFSIIIIGLIGSIIQLTNKK